MTFSYITTIPLSYVTKWTTLLIPFNIHSEFKFPQLVYLNQDTNKIYILYLPILSLESFYSGSTPPPSIPPHPPPHATDFLKKLGQNFWSCLLLPHYTNIFCYLLFLIIWSSSIKNRINSGLVFFEGGKNMSSPTCKVHLLGEIYQLFCF